MSDIVAPPLAFWQSGPVPPAPSTWASWKTSFSDYLFLLETFHSSAKVTDLVKVKLLRLQLGEEGQKVFDSLNLSRSSYDDALSMLDKTWGLRTNVFLRRYRFCQLRQDNGQSLENFLTRLRAAVQSCDYSSIPVERFEESALLQQLIVGVADERLRESLLLEGAEQLTWDRACDIARSLDHVRCQLQSLPESKSTVVVSKISSSNSSSKEGTSKCFRCGSSHHRANYPQCPASRGCCNKCGKSGHFSRCCNSKPSSRVAKVYPFTSEKEYEKAAHVCSVDPLTVNAITEFEPLFTKVDVNTVHTTTGLEQPPVKSKREKARVEPEEPDKMKRLKQCSTPFLVKLDQRSRYPKATIPTGSRGQYMHQWDYFACVKQSAGEWFRLTPVRPEHIYHGSYRKPTTSPPHRFQGGR